MIELNDNQNFICVIDNEDGTMTTHMIYKELGINETSVVEASFPEMLASMMQHSIENPAFSEAAQDIANKSTIIPNVPE